MSNDIRVLKGNPDGGRWAPHPHDHDTVTLTKLNTDDNTGPAYAAARLHELEAAVQRSETAHAATVTARAAFDAAEELSPDYYVKLHELQTTVRNWNVALKRQNKYAELVTADNAPQPAENLEEAQVQTRQARSGAKRARIAFNNTTEGTELYYQRLETHSDAVNVLLAAIKKEQEFGGDGEDPDARRSSWAVQQWA
jgi:hypothetical protein